MATGTLPMSDMRVVEVELDSMSTSFCINGHKSVSIYWYLNLGSSTHYTLASAGKVPSYLLPSTAYAVLPFYSVDAPYAPCGSLWIADTGVINVYKPSDVGRGYAAGSYLAKNI